MALTDGRLLDAHISRVPAQAATDAGDGVGQQADLTLLADALADGGEAGRHLSLFKGKRRAPGVIGDRLHAHDDTELGHRVEEAGALETPDHQVKHAGVVFTGDREGSADETGRARIGLEEDVLLRHDRAQTNGGSVFVGGAHAQFSFCLSWCVTAPRVDTWTV